MFFLSHLFLFLPGFGDVVFWTGHGSIADQSVASWIRWRSCLSDLSTRPLTNTLPMPSLTDIPVEVFIDNILPLVPLKDILSLTSISKDFAALCNDDTFWKRKLKEDYNFSDIATARTRGYKFLYKGVHNAKTYVWGYALQIWLPPCLSLIKHLFHRASSNGRLGSGRLSRNVMMRGGIPYPKHLNVPGPRIVDLAASGWWGLLIIGESTEPKCFPSAGLSMPWILRVEYMFGVGVPRDCINHSHS